MFNISYILTESNIDKLPIELFKHWVNSFEENEKDILTFRPASHKLQRSRGRMGLEINPNGQLTFYNIGPSEGTASTKARFIAQSPSRLIVLSGGKTSKIIEILKCEHTILKVKISDGK